MVRIGRGRVGLFRPRCISIDFIYGLSIGLAILGIREILSLYRDVYFMSSDLNVPATTGIQPAKSADQWRTVNVFVGNDGTETPPHKTKEYFAQVHQDETVLDLIGENGYFIDLAANDALEFSNTYSLEQKGWNGLCVEPNPAYWYGLAYHRKCQVAGALVGSKVEQVKVKFRGVFGGIVGKLDEKLANRKKEPKANEEIRYTAPLIDVFRKFNVPKDIDYMSLDVEGAEYMIMKDFPFDDYKIKLMTVERPGDDLKKLFDQNGYIFLKDLAWWGETLWAHKSVGLSPDSPSVKKIPYDGQ